MERSNELDRMLQARLSEIGEASFESNPSISTASTHTVPVEKETPSGDASHTKDARQFWETKVAVTDFAPVPTYAYGSIGLGRSAYVTHIPENTKKVAYPLTSSALLPYHGKNMYVPKGGIAAKADSEALSEPTTKGDEEEEDDNEGNPRVNYMGGNPHLAVRALLETSNMCLSLLSGTYRPSTRTSSKVHLLSDLSVKPKSKPLKIPRNALLSLLSQFTSIRTKGYFNMQEVNDTFKVCQIAVEEQLSNSPAIEDAPEIEEKEELIDTLRQEFNGLRDRYVASGEPWLEDTGCDFDIEDDEGVSTLPTPTAKVPSKSSTEPAKVCDAGSSTSKENGAELGEMSEDELELAMFSTCLDADPEGDNAISEGGEVISPSNDCMQTALEDFIPPTEVEQSSEALNKLDWNTVHPTLSTTVGDGEEPGQSLGDIGSIRAIDRRHTMKRKRSRIRFPACFRSATLE